MRIDFGNTRLLGRRQNHDGWDVVHSLINSDQVEHAGDHFLLKIANIRLPVGTSEATLAAQAARRLKVLESDIREWRILRKSLDVRQKNRLEYVYTLAVGLDPEDQKRLTRDEGVRVFERPVWSPPEPGTKPMRHRPIVVGAGPAGLLAAYQLATAGYAPLILERGQQVRQRVADVRAFDQGGPLDPESNYLFGEGGAGTFSDGKLTCRNTGPDTDHVLEILAASKGKESILYEAKPHLGSNRLPAVVKSLRSQIIAQGGEFLFGCRLDDIDIRDGRLTRLITNQGTMESDVVLIGIGHSARDTIGMLVERGVPAEFKPFQMGIRIEQPQATVSRVQFGASRQAQLLGPADYTMNVTVGEREVFSFCMCAGGYVMPSVSEHGHFCTNGMSRSFHESPFANSGIVVTIFPEDLGLGSAVVDPMAGIRYQAAIERKASRLSDDSYRVPIQGASDFVEERETIGPLRSSYPRGVQVSRLRDFLPGTVAEQLAEGLTLMDHRWRGEFLRDATVVGPEARGSCPIRFPRDPISRESTGVQGLYPIGEGAGYAGGIVSAAVDGLRSAGSIICRYRPSNR